MFDILTILNILGTRIRSNLWLIVEEKFVSFVSLLPVPTREDLFSRTDLNRSNWIKILLPSLHHFRPWNFLAEGISSLSDCWYQAGGHLSPEISQWLQSVSSPLCPRYGTPCRPASNNQASVYFVFSNDRGAISRKNFKTFFAQTKDSSLQEEITRRWPKIVGIFFSFSSLFISFVHSLWVKIKIFRSGNARRTINYSFDQFGPVAELHEFNIEFAQRLTAFSLLYNSIIFSLKHSSVELSGQVY